MAKAKKNSADSAKTAKTAKTNAKSEKNAAKIVDNRLVGSMADQLPSVHTAPKKYGTDVIEENRLERFENRTLVRRYTIEFTCPEFTCLCPRSGFPDFATIRIKVVPDKYCVELKSLKLYINSFRDKHVFHEDVTNIIIQDLIDLLDPWEITVVGDFTVRGNVHTVVTATHTK
jgi:7-cyano-7-deazaguanine reductase